MRWRIHDSEMNCELPSQIRRGAPLADNSCWDGQRLLMQERCGDFQLERSLLVSIGNRRPTAIGTEVDLLYRANDGLWQRLTTQVVLDCGQLVQVTADDLQTQIVAPMTGKIIAIDVNEGQQLAKGDRLLTIEAMKMENFIVAERSLTITNVKVTVGSTVERGNLLMLVDYQ